MANFLRTSLSARCTVFILAMVCTVGFGFLAFTVTQTVQYENAKQRDQLNEVLDVVQRTVSIACFLADRNLADEVATGLLSDHSVGRVTVSAGGHILSERGRTDSGVAASGVPLPSAALTRKIMSPFNPDEAVGEIVLTPNSLEIRANVRRAVWATAIPILLQIVFIGLTIVMVVASLVTRPITNISARLHELRAEMGQKLEIPKGNAADEIGLLVRDVNAMAEHLLTVLNQARESGRLLSEAQRLGHIGSWYYDATGAISWSPELYQLYGVTPDTFSPSLQSQLDLIHPEERTAMQEWLAACADGKKPAALEYRASHSNGSLRHFRIQGDAVEASAESPRYAAGTVQDISEQKQAEQTLLRINTELKTLGEANEIAAAVIKTSREGVMVIDAGLRIKSVNPAFETITGYPEAQVLGRTPRILFSGRHEDAFFHELNAKLDAQGKWQGEIWNRRSNGEIYPQETSISVLHDADGRITHYASVFADNTVRNQLEAKLRELASVDGLTGIANRRTFDEFLAREWASALRHGLPISLVMADIDHFKLYNDNNGHLAGDECLHRVAGAINACANRSGDLVARYGGEEFAAILANASAATAAAVAEDMRARVAALALPHGASETAPFVTISLGVATFIPQRTARATDLIAAADRALYQAKGSGRNRVVAEITASALGQIG